LYRCRIADENKLTHQRTFLDRAKALYPLTEAIGVQVGDKDHFEPPDRPYLAVAL